MIRKRGYSMRGEKVAVRGDFQRKPRISVLALSFVSCCKDFVYSARGRVNQYPGSNSVWILDGASIHRHPEIIKLPAKCRRGPYFLPAYCPFFNPIEFLFGFVKKAFMRH
ncbi:uncharacterized protein PITG_15845 [Phytophthora infestans T30-4]|uniref:Tc1-like transposase DDE domain-containing protein n=1 Tax=Phytophthora infestans (strain T30-4) TaxID=403677 RepID=D0NRV4_PHYIT|nr:uncharacterized protein PITG_15845 [Phytophthora infestans T30-4]EEY63495.1 conserved hypothetical protein [Phytophthora infestans T30-4]|eukprot:XP_002898082.1 conserved hypothetical protein [Phytophthora infestans T30-4]